MLGLNKLCAYRVPRRLPQSTHKIPQKTVTGRPKIHPAPSAKHRRSKAKRGNRLSTKHRAPTARITIHLFTTTNITHVRNDEDTHTTKVFKPACASVPKGGTHKNTHVKGQNATRQPQLYHRQEATSNRGKQQRHRAAAEHQPHFFGALRFFLLIPIEAFPQRGDTHDP